MEFTDNLVLILMNFDKVLEDVINYFGPWTYLLLFLIITAETGLIIGTILPGDSLLFTSGALAGAGYINIFLVWLGLILGAILGDTINYWLGHFFGPKIFKKNNSRLFNLKYLDITHAFYEKHGGKTIIISRFIPFIRTFAPFIAGVGNMNYKRFLTYNIVGAFLWVTILTMLGYYFGALEIVQRNFEYVIILIIIISVIPIGFEYVKHFLQEKGFIKKDKKIEKTSYKKIKESFEKEKK